MAKVKLAPGAEFDVLTQEELQTVLAESVDLFKQEKLERVRPQAQAITDAVGGASLDVYKVPIGMVFRLARVVVSLDGFSWANLYSAAAGAIEIRRNGQLIDGFNLASGIPNAWRASGDARPQWMNGEVVTVVLIGGPVNVNFTALVEGDLYPRKP